MAADGTQIHSTMLTECPVFDCQKRVYHVRWNLRDERLLAVLGLKYTNLATLHVVHHAALGQAGETADFIQRNGCFVVGIQHAPDAWGHPDDER